MFERQDVETDKNIQKRDYVNAEDQVKHNYYQKHTLQTFAFAIDKIEYYKDCNTGFEMSVWELAEKMNEVIDESDPDLHLPQIVHALQTAEAIRKDYPSPSYDWLVLTGFVHDLGKILSHADIFNEPQWAVVGDTYPTGCPISKHVVYSDYFKDNPDVHNDAFNESIHGIYEPNCGLSEVIMTWGHDEYMYRICIANKCNLPPESLYIIRYHSFYAHHQLPDRDDEGKAISSYNQLLSDYDRKMLDWLTLFQKYDLYSKNENMSQDEIATFIADKKPYYCQLISKYFPEKIRI